ncbi:MAG: hypothetical protein A2428_10690 [Bdellovibrionales bacterium RIFOXYC1_FULL_54_43]|nr:MAG: hypothetical protein A2428_10690 [Bdellovibrionales bacterium RIFOXYC1_FULL_54_43]OFZ85358.1 MAG: hypothetical protein A2603_05465 [Bdellovibrionales bacterium RIFOXYD1_FULL_55_31]
MIYDLQKNWSVYFHSPVWKEIGHFLKSLSHDLKEGEYQIGHSGVIGRIVLSQTRSRAGAKPEAHNRFIDVQIVLEGEEIIVCQPRELCQTCDAYIRERDVEFFFQNSEIPGAELRLVPGAFAVFYPQDAHTPLLMTGNQPATVKKIVIKVPIEYAE